VVCASVAGAQQPAADANTALLRCSAMVARLTAPLDIPNGMPTRAGQPMDTLQYNVWRERTQARQDSAVAVGQACLARLDAARVSDTLLDTLFAVQGSAHLTEARLTTMERMLRAPLPPEQRARSFLWNMAFLGTNAATAAMLRAHLPLIDSLRDIRASLVARQQLMAMVRTLEPRAAYLEFQRAIAYLAGLTPAERATVVRDASTMIGTASQWATTDSTAMEVIGLSFRLLALYPDNPDLLRFPLWKSERIARVGERAQALESPHWLHMPAGATRIPVDDGKVTLVEFTTLSCSACKHSYEPLQRMSAELGAQGLNIVYIVPMGRPYEAETADLNAMFDHFHATLPVLMDAKGTYQTWYKVGDVPQFVLIDRHGVVRDIPLGWFDDGARIRRSVERLLAER